MIAIYMTLIIAFFVLLACIPFIVSDYKKRKELIFFKTTVKCETCGSELLFAKPRDFKIKASEPFQDNLYCPKCKKGIHYPDAFFFDQPANKLKEEYL